MVSRKVIIGLVGCGVVLIGGVFIFQRVRHRPVVSRQSATAAQVSARQQRLQQEDAAWQARVNKLYQSDKDFDGLTDAEEQKLGTDSISADTDKDGLLDGDEAHVYKTDPLKFDTYGIGHSDGWGVRNGVILSGGQIDRARLAKLKK